MHSAPQQEHRALRQFAAVAVGYFEACVLHVTTKCQIHLIFHLDATL